MKKYVVVIAGCDDLNEFEIELTDDELNTIIKVFNENNKLASYCCKPTAHVYTFDYYDRYVFGSTCKPLTNSYFDD